MRCLNCGGAFDEIIGDLIIDNERIGSFTVHYVNYKKCNNCGKVRYPSKTAKLIENRKNEIIQNLISKLPICDFVGATSAAEILGISRQAMHKHHKIRKGFIYFLRHEGRILYHKKSVILFKKEEDGRFPLRTQHHKKQPTYILVNRPKPRTSSWEIPRGAFIGSVPILNPILVQSSTNIKKKIRK